MRSPLSPQEPLDAAHSKEHLDSHADVHSAFNRLRLQHEQQLQRAQQAQPQVGRCASIAVHVAVIMVKQVMQAPVLWLAAWGQTALPGN